MSELQILYHSLWWKITTLQNKILYVNNKFYLFSGKLGLEDGKVFLEFYNENQKIVRIPDLITYLVEDRNITGLGLVIEEQNIDDFLRNYLTEYMKTLVIENHAKCDTTDIKEQIKVPSNLKAFVCSQIPKWVTSAIIALSYEENVHYVVDKGEIKPVDFNTTGVIQSSTTWSDGLHQFLQLKHGLKLTSETLITNFLSNASFFRRYGKNIFGFTGTLGLGEYEKKHENVLTQIYNVDTVIIPHPYRKQYIKYRDVVVNTEEEWSSRIVESVGLELQKQRGVLVICESIKQANLICGKIRDANVTDRNIKLYTMNNMDQEKQVHRVHPGDVIVATNLAGRGTDIKTDRIETCGGLHVCLTFLPPNLRVLEQALGRTARQGKRGTGQLIINALTNADLPGHYEQCSETFNKSIKSQMRAIEDKEKLFSRFCALMDTLRENIRNEVGFFDKAKQVAKAAFITVMPTVYEVYHLAAIEERWAMFLRQIDDDLSVKFEAFEEEIRNDFSKKNLIKNPFYCICLANYYFLNNKLTQAEEYFERAILLDKHFSCAALVGKATCILKKKKSTDFKNSYKVDALKCFQEAEHYLNEEMDRLVYIQTILKSNVQNAINNELWQQYVRKINMLGTYSKNVERAISIIKKSQRLVDIGAYHNIGEFVTFFSLERDPKTRNISKLEEMRTCVSFELVFNDLILKQGWGTVDQAVETIKALKITDEKSTNNLYRPLRRKIDKITELLKIKDNNKEIGNKRLEDTGKRISQASNCFQIRDDDAEVIGNQSFHERLVPVVNVFKIRDANAEVGNQNREETRRRLVPAFNVFPIGNTNDEEAENLVHERQVTTEEIRSEFCEDRGRKIEIRIKDLTPDQLSALFSPHVVKKDLTKQEALAKLDSKGEFIKNALCKSWFKNSQQIDMEIISENNVIISKTAIKIEEAVKEIKAKTSIISIILTFRNANKHSPRLAKVNIEACVSKINSLQVKALVSQLNPDSLLSVNIYGNPNALKNLEIYTSVGVVSFDDQNTSCIVSERCLADVGETGENQHLKIEFINRDTVVKIVDACQSCLFSLRVDPAMREFLCSNLPGCVSVNFKKLTTTDAISIVCPLRQEGIEFALAFNTLSLNDATALISGASMDQEDIELRHTSSLRNLYTRDLQSSSEFQEFSSRGIEHLHQFAENEFVPWLDVASVTAIAGVQMSIGWCLIASGFGASVGTACVTEGASDLLIAYRIYSNRQFNWSSYRTQKTVSLALSAFSLGISSFKSAAKGLAQFSEGAAAEIVEQFGTRIVTHADEIGKTIKESGMLLKSLASKQVCVAVGVQVAQESLYGLARELELVMPFPDIKPIISSQIEKRVKSTFYTSNFKRLLRKILTVDEISDEDKMERKIMQIVSIVLRNQHAEYEKDLLSAASNILKVANLQGSGLTNIMAVSLGAAGILYQVIPAIERVYSDVLRKLQQYNDEYLRMRQLIACLTKLPLERAEQFCRLLPRKAILENNPNLVPDSSLLGEFAEHRNKVINYFTRISNETQLSDLSGIVKLVSDTITDDLVRIVKSKFQLDALVTYLSHRAQNLFLDGKLSEQIDDAVKDYTIAYSQGEIIRDLERASGSSSSSGRVSKEVKKFADSVLDNGKPAGLVEIIYLAKNNDIDLKIVDKNYKPTPQDLESNVKLVVYETGKCDATGIYAAGCYSLKDKSGNTIQLSGTDSGYDVLHSLTKKSPQDLRNEVYQGAMGKSEMFERALKAEDWVKNNYPKDVNKALLVGGKNLEAK